MSLLFDVELKETDQFKSTLDQVGKLFPGKEISPLTDRNQLAIRDIPISQTPRWNEHEQLIRQSDLRFTLAYSYARGVLAEKLFAGKGGILLKGQVRPPCQVTGNTKAMEFDIRIQANVGNTRILPTVYPSGRSPFSPMELEKMWQVADRISYSKKDNGDLDQKSRDAFREILHMQSKHLPDGLRRAFCGYFQRNCDGVTWTNIVDQMADYYFARMGENGKGRNLIQRVFLSADNFAKGSGRRMVEYNHWETPILLQDVVRQYLSDNLWEGVQLDDH